MSKSRDKDIINLDELARQISYNTGFTQRDVTEVLRTQNEVIAALIAKGYDIKVHKLMKIELEDKPEKKAWNGLDEKYYIIPEKKVIKFKAMSQMKEAIDELNSKDIEDNDEDSDAEEGE